MNNRQLPRLKKPFHILFPVIAGVLGGFHYAYVVTMFVSVVILTMIWLITAANVQLTTSIIFCFILGTAMLLAMLTGFIIEANADIAKQKRFQERYVGESLKKTWGARLAKRMLQGLDGFLWWTNGYRIIVGLAVLYYVLTGTSKIPIMGVGTPYFLAAAIFTGSFLSLLLILRFVFNHRRHQAKNESLAKNSSQYKTITILHLLHAIVLQVLDHAYLVVIAFFNSLEIYNFLAKTPLSLATPPILIAFILSFVAISALGILTGIVIEWDLQIKVKQRQTQSNALNTFKKVVHIIRPWLINWKNAHRAAADLFTIAAVTWGTTAIISSVSATLTVMAFCVGGLIMLLTLFKQVFEYYRQYPSIDGSNCLYENFKAATQQNNSPNRTINHQKQSSRLFHTENNQTDKIEPHWIERYTF